MSQRVFAPFAAGLVQGLKQTGYVGGQNVTIEYRWVDGPYDLLSTQACGYGTQDEQWRKLERVVQTAKEIWQ